MGVPRNGRGGPQSGPNAPPSELVIDADGQPGLLVRRYGTSGGRG